MQKLKRITNYVLLSCFISDVLSFAVLPFVDEYNPNFFFLFIFPLSPIFFRYDSHRHYLTSWFYVHFEWRFHWS